MSDPSKPSLTVGRRSLLRAAGVASGLLLTSGWTVARANPSAADAIETDANDPGSVGGWSRCYWCNALYRGLYTGVCSGNALGPHWQNNSLNYWLLTKKSSAPGQLGWRRCYGCDVLYRGPDSTQRYGVCAAGGRHYTNGWDYIVPHDDQIGSGYGPYNGDWRHCINCDALYRLGNPQPGACPGASSSPFEHDLGDSFNYYMFYVA